MIKHVKLWVAGLLAMGIVATIGGAPVAFAADACDKDPKSAACEVQKGVNRSGGNDQAKNCGPSGAKRVCGLEDFIQSIINILLFVIGAVSVIVIIIGGIRYVLSAGDSSQVTAAKNTVLYAVVGLIVAIMAYAIVDFVVDKLAV